MVEDAQADVIQARLDHVGAAPGRLDYAVCEVREYVVVVAGAANQDILAESAKHLVVAGATDEGVVSRISDQNVIAGAAVELVVAKVVRELVVTAQAVDDVVNGRSAELSLPAPPLIVAIDSLFERELAAPRRLAADRKVPVTRTVE